MLGYHGLPLWLTASYTKTSMLRLKEALTRLNIDRVGLLSTTSLVTREEEVGHVRYGRPLLVVVLLMAMVMVMRMG